MKEREFELMLDCKGMVLLTWNWTKGQFSQDS